MGRRVAMGLRVEELEAGHGGDAAHRVQDAQRNDAGAGGVVEDHRLRFAAAVERAAGGQGGAGASRYVDLVRQHVAVGGAVGARLVDEAGDRFLDAEIERDLMGNGGRSAAVSQKLQ